MKDRNELLKNLNSYLEKLRTFSCPEFNGVYSKVYFKEIIKNQLEHCDQPYSFIFGDFNKMGLINDVFGHDFGDNALNLAIKIIKKSVPSNSMIVRVGGDELYIITPNSDKQTADKYCNNIHTALAKKSVLIGGLSIELASSDSSYGNIDKIIDLTDAEVSKIKADRREDNSPADVLADDFLLCTKPDNISDDESLAWDELNESINISIYEFLQNFRPSRTLEFDKNQILDTTSFVTNSFIHLLNEKLDKKIPENVLNIIQEDYPIIDEGINTPINSEYSANLDINDCNLIHSLVSKNNSINLNNYTDEEIENLLEKCNNVLELLIRDNTGLLNKSYFRHFLAKHLCTLDKSLSASYITASGIKLSNSAFDHAFTDIRLDKTNSVFINSVKDNLEFSDNSFDISDNNIYLLSQGAGNYLFLYPSEFSNEIKEKISTVVNNVNNQCDIKKTDSSFKISYYSTKDNQQVRKDSTDELIKYIRRLKEEANYTKDPLKKQLFKSADAFFAFKKSINSCIDYYLENIPNASDDINKSSIFIKNIYTCFLNQEVLHNNTKYSKKTTGINKEHYSGDDR